MKTTFFPLIVLGLFIICFSACKKNNDTQPQPVVPTDTTTQPQTIAQRMQHKWYYEHEDDTTFNAAGGVLNAVTLYGTPGDYFDYRADNKRYIYQYLPSAPHYDTTAYVILNDSTFVFGYDTARITVLTDTRFEYWFRDGVPSTYTHYHGYFTR
ncbi:MAG: hypothetical protein QM737_11545 [Ferruginibacter sp.]